MVYTSTKFNPVISRLKELAIEDGFGAMYSFDQNSWGPVYIGEWKDGLFCGMGTLFWLESSITWKTNSCPTSPITEISEGN